MTSSPRPSSHKTGPKAGPKAGVRSTARAAAHDPIGPLTDLEGIGKSKAARLAGIGVANLRDLLFLLPRRIQVWPEPITPAAALEAMGEFVTVHGRVREIQLVRLGGKRSLVRMTLEPEPRGDGSPICIDGIWFNQPWMRQAASAGDLLELHGRVVDAKGPALQAPRIGTRQKPLPEPGTLEPEYIAPEGISPETVAQLCTQVTERLAERVREPLPDSDLAQYDLPALPAAVRGVHRPQNLAAYEAGRRRLALETLIAVQARVQARRSGRSGAQARPAKVDETTHAELLARFAFTFTPGQLEVCAELRRDLARRIPMRRLLQGDVGSGKTALAAYAAMAVVEAGGQVAIMAPTELLAEQHFLGLRGLLRESGIETDLLTGSVPKDERRYLLQRLLRGELNVLFGTHALFSKDVHFARLDLCIIDEQHRFGVGQRGALLGKDSHAHLLLMTATPIPRTLAMTLYGDLDVSILRGAPPGRGALRTRWVRGQDRRRVPAFLRERLEAGEQVYWVTPRIGDAHGEPKSGSKDSGAKGAERRFDEICASSLSEFGVELVHGRIPAEERAYRLDRFRRGEVGLLVATTVIEVGVDVANATVMVIEHAERLGLAQLHQLRGRVGRGPKDSWCLLYSDKKAAERMQLLERTRDGFELAEEDLRQRGMGDLGGVRQSGINTEGLADPEQDADLWIAAREIIRRDPQLAQDYLR